ncbi:hypothetical protein ACRRTK_005428 [Alexandromys fortis]
MMSLGIKSPSLVSPKSSILKMKKLQPSMHLEGGGRQMHEFKISQVYINLRKSPSKELQEMEGAPTLGQWR